MHPFGDELVVHVEGALTLHLEIDEHVRTLLLRDGQAVINSPGVWHTADVMLTQPLSSSRPARARRYASSRAHGGQAASAVDHATSSRMRASSSTSGVASAASPAGSRPRISLARRAAAEPRAVVATSLTRRSVGWGRRSTSPWRSSSSTTIVA